MNKVILRFNVVKSKEVFEVVFDTRLSFKENFNLLNEIFAIYNDYQIVDPNKRLALNRDTPLSVFGFSNFITLYLY